MSTSVFRAKIMINVLFLKTLKHLEKYKNLKVRNKSFNSDNWLKRREVDPYIELAKQQNYRCRSAFKLIDIDDKHKLLKPGLKVLDIGAAPGSWSQVLAGRTNSNGKDENSPVGLVIAVDLGTMQSIDGVIILPNMDFKKESTQNKILELLGKENKFDFIFSDMAPAATGVKCLDQENIVNLIYSVVLFSVKHLKVKGGCLIKIWDGKENYNIKQEMMRFFKFFNFVKPKASYASSSETYILAREFLGVKV